MSIIFEHPSTDPVTLSKSSKFPYNQTGKVVPNQLIGKAVGGAVKVATLGTAEKYWTIEIEYETEVIRNALLTFFVDIDYATNVFTFSPDDGSSYTVRLWNTKGLDFPVLVDNGAKFYSLIITLRQEIT